MAKKEKKGLEKSMMLSTYPLKGKKGSGKPAVLLAKKERKGPGKPELLLVSLGL